MRRLQFASNDISFVTTGRISTKVDRIVPLEVLYQNCSNRSASLHKIAPKLKIKKKKKNLLKDFKIISQKCFLGDPLPKLLNGSAPLNKMAAKTKNF